jgi:hypothetical protein
MPIPGRISLGEALISTTLLSIYLGSRCAALAITAAQTSPTLCAHAAASVRKAHHGPPE